MESIYTTTQNEYYATLQDAMTAEKLKYINSHTCTADGEFFGSAPRQFNINIARSVFNEDEEKLMYAVEFCAEGEWTNAITWQSGDEATKIFLDCDASDIDDSLFESDWIEQV